MLRHVQKSSLFPARINVAFPPPSRGRKDVAPQLQREQKPSGMGGLLLGSHSPSLDTAPSPGYCRGSRGQGTKPMSSGWRFPSPHVWAWMGTLQPPPQQAKGKASCASSFRLLSLPFKARSGKEGRAKHLMQVSEHSFEHPWAIEATDAYLPLLQGAAKG